MKAMCSFVAAVSAALVLTCEFAIAATYYVDPVNGTDAPNTTGGLSTPFKTIAYTGGFVDPGDTVYLRGTGHFGQSSFNAVWSGTSGAPVTVASYPGETAVFDPGIAAFKTVPNTAWEPSTDVGAATDEYVSVASYTSGGDYAVGAFLDSHDRLLTYSKLEDLRASNESDMAVPLADPRPAGGPLVSDSTKKRPWCYRGPGLFWARSTTGKLHVRLAHTNLNSPGITDYTGETDPRLTGLSIIMEYSYAANVTASDIIFQNIVFQNGGESSLRIQNAQRATFDHCTVHAARFGLRIEGTKFVKFLHCVFDGNLPSYTSRQELKEGYDYIDENGNTRSNGACGVTNDILMVVGGGEQDMEIAYCEFRNTHDAIQIWGYRPRVHHNLFENINDEVFYLDGTSQVEDVRIYNNVIRKALHVFSHAAGTQATVGDRYYYRNIIDQRIPTLGYHRYDAGAPSNWRQGGDFKMNKPVNEFYCYQNTFIAAEPTGTYCSMALSNSLMTNLKTRRFMNNLHMTIGSNKAFYQMPDPAYPMLSDGNVWWRRSTTATSPMFSATTGNLMDWNALQNSLVWQQFYSANGVGWETRSRVAYPQFINVADISYPHSVDYPNTDYRIANTSPAIGAGAPLPTNWPDSEPYDATPDVGALPAGAGPIAVGVDGRFVFPETGVPIADAGDFSILEDSDQNGFETVILSGSGSSASAGISSYTWYLGETQVGTGVTVSKELPAGTHQVYLEVMDGTGANAWDRREITINDSLGLANLALNPGFEDATSAWALTTGAIHATTPVHYGSGALKLATNGAEASQIVPISPGTLVVSAWVKTSGLVTGEQADLTVLWRDTSGASLGTVPVGQLGGTQNWTYLSSALTAPFGAAYGEIILSLAATSGGFACFDDVRLLISNNLKNGHFESGSTSWTLQPANNYPTLTDDPTHVRSGYQAMKMVGTASYRQAVQTIPTTPGTHTISAWIKADSMPAGKLGYVQVEWVNSSGSKIGSTNTIGTTGSSTQPYTLISRTLTAPTGTVSCRVYLKIDGNSTGGSIWFDDIVFQ